MCTQQISLSQDSSHLNYLDNCISSKIYPPLRLYEDEDFMWIDGLDSKKASISKVGFQVYVDEILYTDLDEARRALLTDINAVNTSGSSPTGAETVIQVSDVSHLPTPINGDINLLPSYTYIFTKKVDLNGSRLVAGSNTVIIGYSSENCGVTSTGLSSGIALLKASSTCVVRYIEFRGSGTALDIDCTGNTGGGAAFDWTGVNFEDFSAFGTIKNFDNFIFRVGVFRNGKNLIIDGNFQSCVFETSLFLASGDAGNLVSFPSTVNSSRRVRFEGCPIIIQALTKGIYADPAMTINAESFILKLCPFSGGTEADRLPGINFESTKSLIKECEGIINSANICFYSMNNNTIPTSVSGSGLPTKILGSTNANSNNQKFDTSIDNRATYLGGIERFFVVNSTASVSSNSNNDQIGFYISLNGVVINESEIYVTTNNNNRAENVSIQSPPIMLNQGDYIEVFAENNTDSSPFTVTFLNSLIKEA